MCCPEVPLPHLGIVFPVFLPPPCLAGWLTGWLPFSLCPPAPPIPPLHSYWLLRFLLGGVGRQGKKQHIFTRLNNYSATQTNATHFYIVKNYPIQQQW